MQHRETATQHLGWDPPWRPEQNRSRVPPEERSGRIGHREAVPHGDEGRQLRPSVEALPPLRELERAPAQDAAELAARAGW
jgi:hypothetical protein